MVSSPTFFGAGKSVGLMGERGAANERATDDDVAAMAVVVEQALRVQAAVATVAVAARILT